MTWSMPRPVLQVVAAFLAVASLGAFTLGALTAPPRGRLPGERGDGQVGQILEATEAQPLSAERIGGAPEPKVLTEEEKAKLEEEKKAKAEAAALAKAEADKGAPVTADAATAPVAPPPALQEVTPPVKAEPKIEDPPF